MATVHYDMIDIKHAFEHNSKKVIEEYWQALHWLKYNITVYKCINLQKPNKKDQNGY